MKKFMLLHYGFEKPTPEIMAAWKKCGRIERHRERLVRRMGQKGIAEEFAEAVFNQIRGFGEYGFPESHAASFALIAYATAWMKCHYPAAFACALLNSQPMGFYAASQLVQDLRRHGVEVRGVDINRSSWDCSLEEGEDGAAVAVHQRASYAVRLEGIGFPEREPLLLQ